MGALARSRALQGHRDPGSLGCVDKRARVEGPGRAVEVARQEPAGVVAHEWVQTDVHPTRQVRLDDPVGQPYVRTALSPGVGRTADDGGAPSRLPVARVLPPGGVDVVASGEQRPEQRHLGLR